MSRTKRIRYAALETLDNVTDHRRATPGWFRTVFSPDRPVLLEVGCGRGEYTLALARARRRSGVLGVDFNGARLWVGASRARDQGLTNAHFFRAPAEVLDDHLPAGCVREIWVPFPDPLPKQRQARHRLVSPAFLQRYRRLLADGGLVHVKSDDEVLIAYAEESVRTVGGQLVEEDEWRPDEDLDGVQTTYESRYRRAGRPIHVRRFRLDDTP